MLNLMKQWNAQLKKNKQVEYVQDLELHCIILN